MLNRLKRSLTLRPRFSLAGGVCAGLALTLLLSGCGSDVINDAIPDQRLAYKKQQEAGENLEIPPDLTSGTFDDALDIPPAGGATYSEYSGSRAKRQRVAASGEVLPETPDVELKRRDNERWLEVQASPQQVWPQVISFWREQGILLVEQNPTVGVMRTDWLDNRAEIRRDFVTRMISKVVEGVYATSTRDQYSVRIEPGTSPGTTEIHLTHRGMEERLVTNAIGDGSRTIWEPSGTDSGKEAEMLRRLMVFLGASEQRAAAVSPASGASSGRAGGGLAIQPVSARLVTEGGSQALVIQEDFRRAWRTTGSALDRAGFSVEDRDLSQGVYYVRYAGQDGASDRKSPGLLSRMAFWKKNEVDPVKQYQVRVQGGETESRVTVLDASGKPDTSESSQRILTLMKEQIR
ncbi:outer membrane protein assembly factor BamC [Thiocapsa bogorovii]|uniref:outer membrane protein assembly factor BamC n=1 Tax=Thiocapsa bogorovii TaxID=521689 RepID=UPI001E4C8A37|nr:outer membrane protein assembly factor BamC [Thiocapsa bogorovii]UHD16964.1 outer membrane protein assembly factor BamC [Thiocapsa bogorovii]